MITSFIIHGSVKINPFTYFENMKSSSNQFILHVIINFCPAWFPSRYRVYLFPATANLRGFSYGNVASGISLEPETCSTRIWKLLLTIRLIFKHFIFINHCIHVVRVFSWNNHFDTLSGGLFSGERWRHWFCTMHLKI